MTTKEKAQNLMQIDDNNNPQFATLHPNLLIGIYQAFEILKYKKNTSGALYEFGVYKGFSFWYANQLAKQFDFDFEFYGFDSFEGLPKSNVDIHRNWAEGSYSCSKEIVEKYLNKWGMPLPFKLLKSFYSEASFDNFEKQFDLKKCCIAIIDCDIYESAVEVLNYLTPKFNDEPIVLFDDYNAFNGDANHGERKALSEFKISHPQFKFEPLFSFGPYGQAFQVEKI